MKYDVFISYSRYDTNVVNEFVTELENEGFSVWIDRDGIESGDAFKKLILRAIKESQVVLFFSSEHSNQSDWTAKEIGIAVKYKKHIIPIKLDNSNFNEDVEFDLVNLDFVDYSVLATREGMKERLHKTLRNKLGKEKERLEAERKVREAAEITKLEQESKAEEARRKAEQEWIEAERNKKAACPVGAINGIFSVSPTKKVYFSMGNLQYQASTNCWRFAQYQYDFIGEGNGQFETKTEKVNLFKKREVFVDKRDWVDLFGWGTGNNPANYSESNEDYYSFVDWGRNRIVNGGVGWRTLTRDEWKFVLEERSTKSGIRYARACVNNMNGVILLPDTWSSDFFTLQDTNQGGASFKSNVIDSSIWIKSLQAYGAVFLPAAGYRNGSAVAHVGSWGRYWSGSYFDGRRSWLMYFGERFLGTGLADSRYLGLSVRLVCPIE